MTLISFLQSVLGMLFVIRTLQVFRARGVIRESTVTKTGTIILTSLCLSQFGLVRSPGLAFFATFLLATVPLIFVLFLERQTIAEWRARVPIFLDRWILNLRLGHSVSAARDEALREEDRRFHALMRPLFDTTLGERARHLLVSGNIARELAQICTATHAALERLENLRRLLRQTAEFRRKSGQARLQTTIQSLIMVGLLLALAIFTVHRYGWTRCGDLIMSSALLTFIGVALMQHLARKTKWKL